MGKCEVPYTKSQYSFKFALKSSYIQESPMALDRSPESWHMMYWSGLKRYDLKTLSLIAMLFSQAILVTPSFNGVDPFVQFW